MTDRRSLAHLRSPSRDKAAVSVAMHRQLPAGPRDAGWAVRSDDATPAFVKIGEDQDWSWTTSRRDAALFLTRAAADRWIAGNLASGSGRAVKIKT